MFCVFMYSQRLEIERKKQKHFDQFKSNAKLKRKAYVQRGDYTLCTRVGSNHFCNQGRMIFFFFWYQFLTWNPGNWELKWSFSPVMVGTGLKCLCETQIHHRSHGDSTRDLASHSAALTTAPSSVLFQWHTHYKHLAPHTSTSALTSLVDKTWTNVLGATWEPTTCVTLGPESC